MTIDSKVLISAITIIAAALIGHVFVLLFLKIAGNQVKDDNGIGKWLGFFERALVSLFVCLGLISQTVFIFAVKAAVLGYRLPDDKEHRKKVAEYMLLGTMVSYFAALIIGLCGRWWISVAVKG